MKKRIWKKRAKKIKKKKTRKNNQVIKKIRKGIKIKMKSNNPSNKSNQYLVNSEMNILV